jgi:hypothetical protein
LIACFEPPGNPEGPQFAVPGQRWLGKPRCHFLQRLKKPNGFFLMAMAFKNMATVMAVAALPRSTR